MNNKNTKVEQTAETQNSLYSFYTALFINTTFHNGRLSEAGRFVIIIDQIMQKIAKIAAKQAEREQKRKMPYSR